jgi:hypothetical protein
MIMAIPFVDPNRVKYPPEMLIEAINQVAVTTGGDTVASYRFTNKHVTFENPHVESTANLDFIVATDSGEKVRIRSNVPTDTDPLRRTKVLARNTLDVSMQMTVGAGANVWSRYNITVRKPLPVDKLRYDENLDANEVPISDSLNLDQALSIGTIGYHPSLLNIDPGKMFDEIITVERLLTAMAANSESVIGGAQVLINPGTVAVLLGVMIDTTNISASASDTYLMVDRDGDYGYMQMDVTALPDNLYVPCFVPAIETLKVWVKTITGSAGQTVPAGFIYGVRPLNISDHLLWGIPYSSNIKTAEVNELLSKNQRTANMIKAGVI